MKNNQTTFLLVGVLFLSTFITAVVLFFYNRSIRTLADVEMKTQQVMSAVPQIIQALGIESVEYSKKNPDITPTLQTVGFLPKTAPAPAARPANK